MRKGKGRCHGVLPMGIQLIGDSRAVHQIYTPGPKSERNLCRLVYVASALTLDPTLDWESESRWELNGSGESIDLNGVMGNM